jgi:predicted transcriptional regulator
MITLNRRLVLNALIKHETLTITDIAKKENLGIVPDQDLLDSILGELTQRGLINVLDDVIPCTYTITDKGINEGSWLDK